jgi:hypothetical protein
MNTYDITPDVEDFTHAELIRAIAKYLRANGAHALVKNIEDGSWLEDIMLPPKSKFDWNEFAVQYTQATMRANRLAPVREH